MFAEALKITPGITAVIGGGGKTSLLRRLGEELAENASVLLCTTTKIRPFPGIPTVYTREELDAEKERLLCMGTPGENGKLTAPEVPLAELAERFDYVLVEADGSAGRPLKAQASHEPVIPPKAGEVILVLGASGFGERIADAAHRPERYSHLAGLRPEDPVTPEAAARVIEKEGLHQKIFVNQAETVLTQARCFAGLMNCPVVLGSIQKGEIYPCLF